MDEKENEHREKRKSTPNPRYSTDDYLLDFTTPERPPAVAKRTKGSFLLLLQTNTYINFN